MGLHSFAASSLLCATLALPACAQQSPSRIAGETADTDAVATTMASNPVDSVAVGLSSDRPADVSQPAGNAAAAMQMSPMVVHKSEFCGCCGLWVDHMRQAGFQIEVRNTEDMNPIKKRLGVPAGKGSCHTAEVGGYFVEGHVPAEDVMRLLTEKPDARGLAVPGMPAGSPGMEMPDGRVQPYVVELVGKDGSTSVFRHHAR